MKKLVFTAITMVAFSSASIANTIEVKEEVISAEETTSAKGTATITKKEDVLRTKCDAIWIISWQSNGGASNYDYAVYQADLAATAAGCSGVW